MNRLVRPVRNRHKRHVRSMVLGLVGVIGVCVVAFATAYMFTPWPRALHLRYEFDNDGEKTARALAALVPADITAILEQPYDSGVALDVYHPAGMQPRTTVVWIHGGGWLA